MLRLDFPKNKSAKLQGYILRVCDSNKIVEFSFKVDVSDSTDSILEHIFSNLGEPEERFEFYYYFNHMKVKKLNIREFFLQEIHQTKYVFFIVETKCKSVFDEF